jgi:hypothetical protein
MIQTILALFLLGGIAGTLGDYCHILSGTLGYPSYIWMIPGTGQPFWVPILMGSATLAIGLSHPWTDHWMGQWFGQRRSREHFTIYQIGLVVLCFLALYGVSGFIPLPNGGLRDLVILAGSLLIWYGFDRTWQGIVLGLGTGVLGTGTEILLTHSDIFYYHPESANFHGVPSWLPWLYIGASVAGGNSGRFLLARRAATR